MVLLKINACPDQTKYLCTMNQNTPPRRFKKNGRVSFLFEGAETLGVVFSAAAAGQRLKVVLDDGVRCVSGSSRIFSPSSEPLPKALINPFKKGDRVGWVDRDGASFVGTVVKVSQTNVNATHDGGDVTTVGHFSGFAPSSVPLVLDSVATPMDAYEVRNYRKIRGHDDTQPFEANIYRNGRRVLAASDDGWGGGVAYEGPEDDLQQLYADAGEWARINGDTPDNECAGIWIDWYVNRRPFGGLAANYLSMEGLLS